MPIKEEKKFGGESFVGYRTLFVNSEETQKLALKYGLSPVKQLKAATDFADTDPPDSLSNEDILHSDSLRFNLGKFFWRDQKSSGAGINYQFINTNINYNSTSPFPGLWDPAGKNKNVINNRSFASPIRYQIGFDQNYMLMQNSSQEAISDKEDINTIEFGSETFIILSIDSAAPPGTYAHLLFSDLKLAYPSFASDYQNLWKIYLSQGKIFSGESPQYLGFGPMVGSLTNTPHSAGEENIIYNDHAFIFSHPYELNDRDDLGSVKVLYADINAEYNFYQERYEQGLGYLRNNKTEGLPTELFLPNFNVILEESKNFTTKDLLAMNGALAIEKENIDKNYLIHSTLNGKLPINILRPLETKNKKYDEVKGRSGNQYLDEWGNAIIEAPGTIFSDDDLQQAANKFKNIIFPLDALKNDDINILKESFPFYNEINFNTDTSTKMADILKNSKLFDALVLDYISQKNNNGYKMKDIDFNSYQELKLNSAAANEGKNVSFDKQFLPLNPDGNKYKTYDFNAFATQIKDLPSKASLWQSIQNVQAHAISISGEEHSDGQMNILQNDPLTQLIYKMTFLSTYSAFVKENLRTYRDIVEGKMAHNETLFYRVEKRNDEGEIIQNFYVLNDSELNDVNLIDTQIRYGKQYTYRIYAIQLVVGNQYFYKNGPSANFIVGDIGNPYQFGDEHFYNLIADTKQSVRLVEIPYVGSAEVSVQEAPPVPPNVDFVPYRGIDNQVLIALNVGTGEYYDTYIPLLPEDEEKITTTAITNLKGQTLFKSEGDASSFELFRISERTMPKGPTSYRDFGISNLAKRVILNRDSGDPTYIDNILPNTKYWYTFRTNDKKHSTSDTAPDFSNPTAVYEIQLINNSGAIYMMINTYDINFFNEQEVFAEKEKTKTMRKYLHLSPSFDQLIINTDAQDGFDYYASDVMQSMENYLDEASNGSVADFKLGYTEETIFGSLPNDENNRFKVRLTSKKTGKKVDIFLRFKKPVLEK